MADQDSAKLTDEQAKQLKEGFATLQAWAASERKLVADIDAVHRDYGARIGNLPAPSPGEGYSSHALAAYVALLVELENRLHDFAEEARKFDVGSTSSASSLVGPMLAQTRENLKEAAYMADFKSVREELVTFFAAMPSVAVDGPNGSRARLADFERRFIAFEPRAAELESEGRPALRHWLTPALEAVRKQLASLDEAARTPPPAPPPAPTPPAPTAWTMPPVPAAPPPGADQAAYDQAMWKIAADTRQAILDSMDRMHQSQVAMNDKIAEMNGY